MDESRSTWGSKRERSKGVWQLRYTVGGDRRAETVIGTESQAEARLAELRVKYEGVSPSMTLSQFYRERFEPWMHEELALKTIESYEGMWRNRIEPDFGDVALADIRPRMIQDWLLTMTHSVAKHSKAVLSSIMERAFALELVEDNPVHRKFQLPPKATSEARNAEVYSHDELEEIASDIHGEDWELVFLLAGFGGATRSEAFGVRLDECYMHEGWFVAPVRRGVHHMDGQAVVRNHGKNAYREESVLIAPPHSQRAMESVRERMAEGHEWACDDGYGNPCSPMSASQAYRRWFCGKPYKYIPFKNLRPSYATWMRDEGYSMDDVARLLRHSTTDMLKRVYDRPRAAQMIDGLTKRYGNLRDS